MPIAALIIVLSTTVFSALLVLVFAWLIGIKHQTGLISGYKPDSAHDEPGLLRFTGRCLGCLAGFMLLRAAALPWLSEQDVLWWAIFLSVGTLLISVVLIVGKQRYVKPPESS